MPLPQFSNPRSTFARGIAHIAAALLLGLTVPAQAAINQFVQGMIASGTAPFGVDDASATDTNIRTFDYATYRVGYSITPTDADALIKLTAGSFTLPGSYIGPAITQAAFFDAKDLPTGSGGCQNITLTALTAAQITAGNVSGVTANGQTLYCVQPPSIGGNNLDFRLTIRGNVPNGAIINPPTTEFSSTNNPLTSALTAVLNGLVGLETFYGLPPLTVRASPKWNLNKSAIRGGLYVPSSGPPGSGPGGVGGANGFVFSWNIGIYAIGSRKGLEALNTAGFTENWSDPDFPNSQLVTWNMQVPGFISTNVTPNNCGNWQNALGVLGNVFDNVFYYPIDYGNFNYAAFDYTVARGGVCQSTTVNQAAKTASFDLINTDWSLTYYPIKRGANSAASNLINPINPNDNSNEWWVASKTILIWVPETDIVVPPSPNTAFLTNTANLFGTSVSGQTNIEPVLSDNSNQQGATRSLSGGMVKVARPWFYLNNPFGLDLALRDPTITGDSQVHQIAPNQAVLSAPQLYNSGTTPYGAGQVCDKIDNTRFTLLDTTNPAYVGSYPGVVKDPLTGISVWYLSGSPSIGPNFVWELGVNTVGTTGGTWSSYNTNNNEYAAPALSGSAQSDTGCRDADAVWYPSVAALLAAGRTLQEVTTVRGKYTNWPGSTAIVLGIPQLSLATFAYSSTDIGPGGSSFVAGSTTIDSFSSNQAIWESGMPGLFGNAAGIGRASDTVKFFQTEYTQISKSSPTNPNNTLVTPGTQVTYALTVNITTSGSAHTATVDVWDVLPAGMDYVPGSSSLGGAPLADPVCASSGLPTTLFPATAGPPASVAGSVPAGFKACHWVLLNQNVVKTSPNAAAGNLPELRFRAAVALNAPISPPVLLNTAFADSTLNQYADAVYGGAQVGFKCNGGQNCFFSNWSLSVAASPGIGLSKSVSRNLAAPNSGFSYTLGYGAVGSSLANARILDVLPYVGDGRTTASAFAGTFGLSGPVLLPVFSVGPPVTTADPSAVALYTSNTPANINRDPYGPSSLDTHHKLNGLGTNSATSTNWCTAAQFLTPNCPTSFANVKGVMILPFAGAPAACGTAGTVPCLPPSALFQATIPVTATGNFVANVYSNDFRADSPSLTARAPGSNLVSTRIVAPDLTLAKTLAPNTVNTGATVAYTLSPRNNTGTNVGIIEASPVPTIVVTDNLPSNLSIANAASVDGGANWNCAASVAPSTVSCTYTGPLPVPVGAAIGNDITVNTIATSLAATTVTVVNTASIALSGQSEVPTTNNAASATLLIKPSFSDVVSIVTLPADAPLGSVVTGTVVFANIASGPGAITASNAIGTVTLSNGQVLTYNVGNLAAGTSTVFTFTTTVPSLNTPLVANSNISSFTQDNNPSNNTSTDSLSPLLPDVSVTLVLPPNAVAGSTVTATVTYTNLGLSSATSVVGTLTLSNGSTVPYTLGTLVPGQTIVTTTVVTVPASGTLTGTATVATASPETTLTNNISLGFLGALPTDISTTIALPSTALVGTTATGTVTFTNTTGIATTITATITINGSNTVVVRFVPANGTATVPISVPVGTTGSTVVANFVSVVPDNTPTNNIATAGIGALIPDMTTSLVLPPNAIAGTTVTATITFSNIGTGTASNVIGTLTLSNGSTVPYPLGTFVPGQNLVTTTVVTVPPSGDVLGTTTVATSTPEVTLTNNQSTASLAITPLADVRVVITAPPSASPGQTITAVVVISNAGPSAAQNVSVTVSLPNGSTTVVFVTSSLPSGATTSVSVVYRVPPAQTNTMTWTATAVTSTLESNTANNVSNANTLVQRTTNATVSGRVWLDTNSDRVYTGNIDRDLAGWRVELLLGGVVVGTATTATDGRYVITGQVPGTGYSIRFKNPYGEIIVSTPYNQGPIAVSGRITENGNPSNGTTTNAIGGAGFAASSIDNITLYANDNTIDQNLPLDPSGVVYDAVTRLPVEGAVVTLIGPNGSPVPGNQLVQGASSMTTSADGIYQFDLLPTAPSGVYVLQITPPTGYSLPPASAGGVSAPGVAPGTSLGTVLPNGSYQPPSNPSLVNIASNATPAAVGVNTAGAVGSPGTQYFLSFNITIGGPNPSASILHNHIPLDPFTVGAILVSKVGDKTTAEVADSVRYTIRLRNTTSVPVTNVLLQDMLPAGFRYILGTTRLDNAVRPNPLGGVGRALTFAIGTIAPKTTVELSYFVRLGVGSAQGDGVNRAEATFTGANGKTLRSNTAVFKVKVLGGVLSNDGCIVGKVVVDCDANHIQNNESGSRELGIPGVRLVLLDGTYAITDNEGKFSLCDIKPQTHVIKVDITTLPRNSRLLPSSNRNAGVGSSLFVDLKGGELARADFIEGSCSPEVLDQVKARRALGAVFAPYK